MIYKATYRCRMCSETFVGHTFETIGSEMMNLFSDIVREKTHTCSDGSIGYADFLGFKREDGQ